MKGKNKNNKKKFLLIAASAMLVLGFAYTYVWQSEINEAYEWPYEVAKGAQQGLNSGISPDGVIEEITGETDGIGDLWGIDFVNSEPDDFIHIKETAKTYETGTDNIDTKNIEISENFIQETQAQGEAQTTLKLSSGNRYAVQSFPYNYGSVMGVVLVGRLNKPNQDKIDMTRNIAITVWLIITAGTYVTLKPFKSRK